MRIRSFALALHWTLRLACAACFVGHGVFGLRVKPEWIPYLMALGIDGALAPSILPVVGTVDILVGLVTLLRPRRAVLLWMTCWGLFTALLRPLAGEPWWEVLERAGNFGVPLALLTLCGWKRGWWAAFRPADPDPAAVTHATTILRVTIGLLLIGHGGYGAFMHKPMLIHHYTSVGLAALPIGMGALVRDIGWFEIALGVTAAAWPLPPLLIFVLTWKLLTEMLYPLSGAPIWEFIERGASYGAPLALYLIVTRLRDLGRARSADYSDPPRQDRRGGRIESAMGDAHQVDPRAQT